MDPASYLAVVTFLKNSLKAILVKENKGERNHITDLSVFADAVNPLLTITAMDQKITLDCINEGEVTEGIFIRTRYGQAAPNINFTPIGGSYQIETGMITWTGAGENRLTWRDDSNFSGSITEVVT